MNSGAWKSIRLSLGGSCLSHLCFADNVLLFREASVMQARVIEEALRDFYGQFEQKVGMQKSQLLFSGNVSIADEEHLSQNLVSLRKIVWKLIWGCRWYIKSLVQGSFSFLLIKVGRSWRPRRSGVYQ